MAVGIQKGAIKGVVGTASDLVKAALLVEQLSRPSNPLDPNNVHMQVFNQAVDGAKTFARGVRTVIEDPSSIGRAVDKKAHQVYIDLVPTARPMAETWQEELRRNLEIGENQGELGVDIGASFVGGPALRGVTRFGKGSKITGVGKYLGEGYNLDQSLHLLKTYPRRNMGQHVIPRRGIEVGKTADGDPLFVIKLPKSIVDSSFNVLKPEGIERGEMYRRHAETDTRFKSAWFPPSIGGVWHRDTSGVRPYSTGFERVFHGLPTKSLSILGAPPTFTLMSLLDGEDDE